MFPAVILVFYLLFSPLVCTYLNAADVLRTNHPRKMCVFDEPQQIAITFCGRKLYHGFLKAKFSLEAA